MSATYIAPNVRAESPTEVLPVVSMPPASDPYPLMAFRRGLVQRRQFRPLGRLEKIMFERSAVANVGDDNPLTRIRNVAVSIDYYHSGPLVGLSTLPNTADAGDVLICSPMAHPPDLPDPEWRPPYPPKQDSRGLPILEAPPRLPQRLRDRASGILPGAHQSTWRRWLFGSRRDLESESDFWFVFQPVTQIMVILSNGLAVIECEADGKGRHAALLYNPARLEGHLVYGHTQVEIFRA